MANPCGSQVQVPLGCGCGSWIMLPAPWPTTHTQVKGYVVEFYHVTTVQYFWYIKHCQQRVTSSIMDFTKLSLLQSWYGLLHYAILISQTGCYNHGMDSYIMQSWLVYTTREPMKAITMTTKHQTLRTYMVTKSTITLIRYLLRCMNLKRS